MERIRVKLFRFNPKVDDAPRYETYEIPYKEKVTILGILRYIYENVDRTLAFRNYECKGGICGECLIRVNGKPVLTCRTPVKHTSITIEPIDTRKVIRDLVKY